MVANDPRSFRQRLMRTVEATWKGQTPGLVVKVDLPGRRRDWTYATGHRGPGSDRPVTERMQFAIGSITKTMTTTAALQLVQEGRLSLEATIDRWLPAVPRAGAITVAQLMNMSSGVGNWADLGAIFRRVAAQPARLWTPRTAINRSNATARSFDTPGSAFDYNNANTTMLGVIVERITGHSLARELQRRLFEPLGLRRTRLVQKPGFDTPHSRGFSTITGKPADTTDWTLSYAWAAGGVASTIDDLTRWGRALGRGELIDSSLQQRRLDDRSLAATASGDRPYDVSYGLGVELETHPGTGQTMALGHNGKVFGFSSRVQYFPATDTVVAVLANGDNGSVADEVAGMLRLRFPALLEGPQSLLLTNADT